MVVLIGLTGCLGWGRLLGGSSGRHLGGGLGLHGLIGSGGHAFVALVIVCGSAVGSSLSGLLSLHSLQSESTMRRYGASLGGPLCNTSKM